jgi:O-antigen/teichoic acid export membrane protein
MKWPVANRFHREKEVKLKLVRRFLGGNASIFAVAQTVFANVAIQSANIACGVLTARTLAPSGRGTLAAIIMWPQLLAYALTLGTPLSFIYYFKKRPDLSRQLSAASIMISIVAGLTGSLIGSFLIPFSLKTYPPETVHFAQITALLAPAGLCTVTLMAQVQSTGSFSQYNLFRFLSPLSILVGIVLLRITGTLTAYHAALVYLLAGMPALFWLVALVWKSQRPLFTGLLTPSKLLLSYGLRAWGADLLGTVASQVDRVLVVSMLSPASMGLYVVAQSAAGILNVIPNGVCPVILPKLAAKSNKEIVDLTGAAVRITLVLMLAASLPLFFGGEFLLHLVYGSKFDGAAVILPFLIVEGLLDGMTSVLSQAYLGAGMPAMVTLLQGCGVFSAIPLMYLLIPRFGVRGAACALMLATSTRFTFLMANFPFRLKVRPPNIFISRRELIAFVRTRQLVPPQQDA